ncbi:hypothetical protein HYC85_029146 [Camellia sinensis]|uniref:Uncharacterized protein n=1 Tax=Camellia sinensis TaxID=4442 RepID=A0A7J7FXA1_CAMSI|nr:hypothetical protein HYC85_029146 [Camellia sinensis]
MRNQELLDYFSFDTLWTSSRYMYILNSSLHIGTPFEPHHLIGLKYRYVIQGTPS